MVNSIRDMAREFFDNVKHNEGMHDFVAILRNPFVNVIRIILSSYVRPERKRRGTEGVTIVIATATGIGYARREAKALLVADASSSRLRWRARARRREEEAESKKKKKERRGLRSSVRRKERLQVVRGSWLHIGPPPPPSPSPGRRECTATRRNRSISQTDEASPYR